MKHLTIPSAAMSLVWFATVQAADSLPPGYWGEAQIDSILDRTLTLHLAPDLSALDATEQRAVNDLLEAGKLLHDLYVESRHHQALEARRALEALDVPGDAASRQTRLLTLFRLFKGPIATTLENERIPFLPVDDTVPGKNVYPWGITRETVEDWLNQHPETRNSILAGRSVVRHATPENLQRDVAALKDHPAVNLLQPGLYESLKDMPIDDSALYAVPYSVAYADTLSRVYALLRDAGAALRDTDPDFADYLDNRARDMLSNDYEAGDASWVTGQFGRLNAQIGSFETYDDELFGAKSFYSLSVLIKDEAESRKLERAVANLQTIEDSLPYARHKRVRSDIPVGVYEVIADFGQARGANTASILPNDADHTRKYGRTILLRHNIMTDPKRFEETRTAWNAAVAEPFHSDLTLYGGYYRTLWHEIGHYLGVATDEQGRSLDIALEQYSDLLEEMKADLVSMYAASALRETGFYNDDEVRAVYAAGVLRTLQLVKPRREQPYQTMQLMQMNYFLQKGLLDFDPNAGALLIDYNRYHEVVGALLGEVLAIQSAGDPQRAAAFVDRYALWDENLQEVLAEKMRGVLKYRYVLVTYAAIDG
jgi:hypothetical protein